MYSFSYLEPVWCSMSSSNCCFLTCIRVSKEAGQVVWYSHLFQNFPQFIVIYTVKGFGIVNKAEIDVFLEFSCFFHDPADVGNLISVFSQTRSNKAWNYYMRMKWSDVKITQSCPTLFDPMDYTVHGILQDRILKWVAVPFSRGSSQPRDRTQVSHIVGRFFTSWATGMLKILPARLQQYVNCELPDVQAGFTKGRGTRDRSNCQHLLDHQKSKRIPEKHLLLLYWLCQSLGLCGSQQTGKF